MSTIIIGAGPAGLACADRLSLNGETVVVHEAAPYVGGMARSFPLWGQTVDVGPHRFFSQDARVNQLWHEHAGADYVEVKRLTRIYYRGRFFHYPLKPFDALCKLGPTEALRCLFSYGRERLSPTALDGSFENWVCSRFGRRLFEIFFKTYSEKLWGLKCTELDSDFAAQRIRKFSLGEAIKTALFPSRGGQHRTLVDAFDYPTGGCGQVYETMAAAVRARGGEIHLSSPVRRVIVADGRVTGIERENGQVDYADHVVSTMPLTRLVATLPDVPEPVRAAAARLRFRNTIIVYLEIAGSDLFPDNWIYVHSATLRTGRITNFRNWAPQICGTSPNTILALEYWANDDDALWQMADAALIDLGTREIQQTGLLGRPATRILNGHVLRVPKSYPIYKTGYKNELQLIQPYLDSLKGLHVIGRYGSFKYNNQDHSILMGMLTAENNIKNHNHDLWLTNANTEKYQELHTRHDAMSISK